MFGRFFGRDGGFGRSFGHGFGRGFGRGPRHGMATACGTGCDDPGPACPCGCTLSDAPTGTTCRVLRLRGGGAVRRRLLDLGIRPDREVTVLRSAPLHDPIEVRVGDSFIVLRRREAARIDVAHV